MLVDLRKCVGCNACVVACKSEHNSPSGIFNTRVLDKEMGEFPKVIRVFVPVLCNHCDEAVCAEVCPTKATQKQDNGIVNIDYDKCIGCAACVEHCPYQVRTLVKDNRRLYPDGKTVFTKPVHDVIPNNVVTKCDLCYYRLEKGNTSSCAEICPTEARIVGDLSDKNSKINELIEKYKAWTMLPEKGTCPRVYYIG
jgi:molybdopterin-containing oxidoreductase family iron-sulfur binding subunit